ncbi:poly [ADP-ribose] polymerase 2 isoform X1 [Ahaetulla prasina]|uniref:poly [ADP-ribose] polymerase 2 isoform X1 n=1 Tax=Ahaetulla prasina TaxID=499056 RepID=UPI0026484340|nr:poly [ADP-ribose] polymerase 2 isoform X1 [Ahaetulla prasina]
MKRKRASPKAQSGNAGSQPDLRWEREISSNQWQLFPPEQSEILSQAVRAKKLTENLGDDEVDLLKMVQWNKESGQENRVRMAIWDQKSYFIWQWEADEEDEWIPYPAATCLDLQAAKKGDREPIVDFTFGERSFKLDTTLMVQTNQETQFDHRMEYKESDATTNDFQLSSSDSEASTSVATKKYQTELDVPVARGQGDGMETTESGSQLSSSDVEASTPVSAAIQTELDAPASEATTSVAVKESQTELDAPASEASTSGHAPKSQTASQGKGDGMDTTESSSQLSSSSDSEASTSVVAKKTQTELDAPASEASTSVAMKESQTELDVPASEASTSDQAPKSQTASQGQGDGMEAAKTLVVKGKAPVDPECTAKLGKAHVYYEGDDIYDVMLNQTSLQLNCNKFYRIQLLEEDDGQSYCVWMRWGRVGKTGHHSLVPCFGDLAKAKEVFTKKFLDKTKNEWGRRSSFHKYTGKYDLVHLDYEAKDDTKSGAAAKKTVSKPKPVSKLDQRVQALIELICNIRTMEDMVIEMKYDTKRSPLGKLTAEQIKAGYRSLQKVEACLKQNETGSVLLEACNEFYTRIPHNFGVKTPPLINTLKELQEKAQLLEALGEIRIGMRHIQSQHSDLEHPLDRSYRSLDCELQPLEKASNVFQVLERYLLSTHAPTHKSYTMTLIDAFAINKRGSDAAFRFDLPNRMLLWHGSRLGNWAGILSQGLRVAPPEAPASGYMFGKGIYFADMSSKSANYCFATREKDIGFLLLSEVALGESNELLEANPEAENLPVSKHSTKGLGKIAPSGSIILNGALVPVGPAKETGIENPNGYTLNYNEFVVYDPRQVRMKYLLKVRFNFTQPW